MVFRKGLKEGEIKMEKYQVSRERLLLYRLTRLDWRWRKFSGSQVWLVSFLDFARSLSSNDEYTTRRRIGSLRISYFASNRRLRSGDQVPINRKSRNVGKLILLLRLTGWSTSLERTQETSRTVTIDHRVGMKAVSISSRICIVFLYFRTNNSLFSKNPLRHTVRDFDVRWYDILTLLKLCLTNPPCPAHFDSDLPVLRRGVKVSRATSSVYEIFCRLRQDRLLCDSAVDEGLQKEEGIDHRLQNNASR